MPQPRYNVTGYKETVYKETEQDETGYDERQQSSKRPGSVASVFPRRGLLLGRAAATVALIALLRCPAGGAPGHWAFTAPERPPVPGETGAGRPRNPIDAFILEKLARSGLDPSPRASREALVRRLSLDLVGLPPTLDELDRATSLPGDEDEALDLEVTRLLASPHFGEVWGRRWLDAARYADSNGYEKDRAREMWRWRDWVVRALNDDLPYDQFLIEQLAGDLLPGRSQDQLLATGFLRNSMINEEGAIDPEQFRMEAMFDRMDCLGKSILGLTLQCVQCHDHKYDPFSQKDYYQLLAFLNNDDELTAPYFDAAQLEKIRRIEEGIRAEEEALKARRPGWREDLERWVELEKARPRARWTILEPHEHGDPGGLSKLTLQADGSLLAGGHRFQGGTWRIKARTRLAGARAVRLELFTNGNLPHRGPGRSATGLFALKEITLEVAPEKEPDKRTRVEWSGATADFEEALHPPGAALSDPKARLYGPVRFAVDGEERTSWTIDAGPGRRNTGREAVFVAREPLGGEGGSELTFELAQEDEIACFRLSITADPGAVADPLPRRARDALSALPEKRSAREESALFEAWLRSSTELSEVVQRIDRLWAEFPEAAGSALVLEAREAPRPTAILRRGDWLRPADPVTPGTPASLNAFPQAAPGNRLGLARWITDRRAPTTARVIVNRVWQAYFGTGIVSTVEDLGRQSPAPSHPELLDWLACELMEPTHQCPGESLPLRPWSLKHLHRLITTSAAYRQSSRVLPVHLERDPSNRLLARGPRSRVDAEIVRDIALRAAGLLETDLGGPPVYSPAPAFLFQPPTSYMPFSWPEATGKDRYRRALYTFRRRSTPYPPLQTFDAPSGDIACVRRNVSNTPLQALVTLNEPLFVEAARALALRMAREGGSSDADRLCHGFRLVTARRPTERELRVLLELTDQQRRHIAGGWLNAAELATGKNDLPDNFPPPEVKATPADVAAYTAAARVLLNLDETLTRE